MLYSCYFIFPCKQRGADRVVLEFSFVSPSDASVWKEYFDTVILELNLDPYSTRNEATRYTDFNLTEVHISTIRGAGSLWFTALIEMRREHYELIFLYNPQRSFRLFQFL